MRLTLNDGKKSSSLTIAWISFWFCLGIILLGVIEEITLGDKTFKFRIIDASIILSLLGPSFGLYGFRRYTDKKLTKGSD